MCSAAIAIAGSDEPPNHSGGYGDCTGGKNSRAPRLRRKRPSKSTVSPAIIRCHTVRNSAVCA